MRDIVNTHSLRHKRPLFFPIENLLTSSLHCKISFTHCTVKCTFLRLRAEIGLVYDAAISDLCCYGSHYAAGALVNEEQC